MPENSSEMEEESKSLSSCGEEKVRIETAIEEASRENKALKELEDDIRKLDMARIDLDTAQQEYSGEGHGQRQRPGIHMKETTGLISTSRQACWQPHFRRESHARYADPANIPILQRNLHRLRTKPLWTG